MLLPHAFQTTGYIKDVIFQSARRISQVCQVCASAARPAGTQVYVVAAVLGIRV